MRGFQRVTKHGTYIDGFAGPQRPRKPDSWAAKVVLEMEPRWLRHFHLFDIDPVKVGYLNRLRDDHLPRDIRIYSGDFNRQVDRILRPDVIGQREATFCVIDQRTMECHWATLERLAGHKSTGHKVELFYFLAN